MGPRRITEAELRGALNWAAREKGSRVPARVVLAGLVRAGLIREEHMGLGGMGRRYELTAHGTVERIARMRV